MKDKDTTKEQLIEELESLRREYTELKELDSLRLKAAVSVLETEEKYRMLIETANDVIAWADAETGIILEVNKKAEKLLGTPDNELVGKDFTLLHPKEDAEYYKKLFKDHVESGGALSGNMFLSHKDGHKIPVEVSSSVLKFGGRKVILGIFRDITRRK
ncbi:MAG: PAS domain S-box protein [bacterium]